MTDILKLYLDNRTKNFYIFFDNRKASDKVAEIESRGNMAELKELTKDKLIVFELDKE